MKLYSKAKTFRYVLLGLPISRACIFAGGLPIIPLLLIKSGAYKEYADFTVGLAIFGVLLSIVTFVAALRFKCDGCGKLPTHITTWGPKPRSRPCSELEALVADFYPFEIRENRFKCIQCGAEFSLVKNDA